MISRGGFVTGSEIEEKFFADQLNCIGHTNDELIINEDHVEEQIVIRANDDHK